MPLNSYGAKKIVVPLPKSMLRNDLILKSPLLVTSLSGSCIFPKTAIASWYTRLKSGAFLEIVESGGLPRYVKPSNISKYGIQASCPCSVPFTRFKESMYLARAIRPSLPCSL